MVSVLNAEIKRFMRLVLWGINTGLCLISFIVQLLRTLCVPHAGIPNRIFSIKSHFQEYRKKVNILFRGQRSKIKQVYGTIRDVVLRQRVLRNMKAPNTACTRLGVRTAFSGIFLACADSRFEGDSPLPPQAGNASR